MYALFGPVVLGLDPLTGPTKLTEKFGNLFVKHEVIRGKPVVQEIGRALDTRELSFFFDETFCEPEVEWARLYLCYETRQALPFISGNSFDGRHFVIEALSRDVTKTTRSGRAVRINATMALLEAPVPDLLDAVMGALTGGAAGTNGNNPEMQQ